MMFFIQIMRKKARKKQAWKEEADPSLVSFFFFFFGWWIQIVVCVTITSLVLVMTKYALNNVYVEEPKREN